MLTLDVLKARLFPNDAKKKAFCQRYPSTGTEDFDTAFLSFFTQASERDFQIILAPFLREAAIHALENSTSDAINSIRDLASNHLQYEENGMSWNAFLRRQGQNRVHATYIEASALGDLLGLNILNTCITNQVTGPLGTLFDQAPADSPTIHLYCQDNLHWFIHEGDYYRTLPDGNCLYNGFAQWIGILLGPSIANEQTHNRLSNTLIEQQRRWDISKDIPPISLEVIQRNISELNKIEYVDFAHAIQLAYDDAMSLNSLRKNIALEDIAELNNEELIKRLKTHQGSFNQSIDHPTATSSSALISLNTKIADAQRCLTNDMDLVFRSKITNKSPYMISQGNRARLDACP